jgi:hypothetical protein
MHATCHQEHVFPVRLIGCITNCACVLTPYVSLRAGAQHTALHMPHLWRGHGQNPQQHNRRMHTAEVLPCSAAHQLHNRRCYMWCPHMQSYHWTVCWRGFGTKRGAMRQWNDAGCMCAWAVQAGQRWCCCYDWTCARWVDAVDGCFPSWLGVWGALGH